MKPLLAMMLSVLSNNAGATGDAVTAPQAANLQSTIHNLRSAEVITIPQMLSYQGRLTDSLGVPVADTAYNVEFRLYTVPSGGASFWNETQTVRTRGGLFSTLIGSLTPIGSVPDAGTAYLGMSVSGGAELSPRLRIVSAAYAYKADTANYARLAPPSGTAGGDLFGSYPSPTVDGLQGRNVAATPPSVGHVLKWTGSAWSPRNDSVGSGGGGDSAWVRGTPDSVLFTVRELGVARGGSQNMLHGTQRSGHTNLGSYACTTGTSGQNYYYCTVTGGAWNVAAGTGSFIGAGVANDAIGASTVVAGGERNRSTNSHAAILGGYENVASGSRSVVIGGISNNASGMYATVIGGVNNSAAGVYSVAGGDADTALAIGGGALCGYHNVAGDQESDSFALICGGRDNSVTGKYGSVGGGYQNDASNGYSTVAGGRGNTASGNVATVAGGEGGMASGLRSVVGGGYGCIASNDHCFVGGGYADSATGLNSVVTGGEHNRPTFNYATVGGGRYNAAQGWAATVAGGTNNTADGHYATVPGGIDCQASGIYSFAAGSNAKARGPGSFVWSDSCGAGDSVRTTTANRWAARARGGVYFYTNLGMTTGSYLSTGGSSWNSVSDSMTKENFRPVDKEALLKALARIRVRDYNLKSQDPSIRHIGPVAQDFHSAFGFGESNTAINMEDADGVALAAIQALYEQNQTLSDRIEAQQAEIEALKGELKRR